MSGVTIVGPNRFTGRVEMLVEGQYHAVCGDGWDDVDADILCGQLGFSTGQASSGKKWGAAKTPYLVTRIRCKGNEDYIHDCLRTRVETNGKDVYCSKYRYAQVNCSSGWYSFNLMPLELFLTTVSHSTRRPSHQRWLPIYQFPRQQSRSLR